MTETLIPTDYPVRTIKRFVDAAPIELALLFGEMYTADAEGRVTIPSASLRLPSWRRSRHLPT